MSDGLTGPPVGPPTGPNTGLHTGPPDGPLGIPASPPARRLATPSWLDLRLVFGVLLVLATVIVGARIYAGADDSVTVWGLAHDVSAGTELSGDDLVPVKVNLYDEIGGYFRTSEAVSGRVAGQDLRSGDLLARSAVASRPRLAIMSLPVSRSRVPPDVRHGDRVDVYAGGEESGTGPAALVLERVVVASADYGGSNMLSSSEDMLLTVQLDPALARAAVPRLTGKSLYVVEQLGASSDGGVAPAPPALPGNDAATPTSSPTR